MYNVTRFNPVQSAKQAAPTFLSAVGNMTEQRLEPSNTPRHWIYARQHKWEHRAPNTHPPTTTTKKNLETTGLFLHSSSSYCK